MNAPTIATLTAALAIAAPALAATDVPPDIVLLCQEPKADSMDTRSVRLPGTVLIWSRAGVMSWLRGGRDSRFRAQVQPGTIFYDEPMNGGHRAGHIDRFTGDYEEIILDTNMKSRVLVRGKCVVPTKPRKF
jgi:hypothetical protein